MHVDLSHFTPGLSLAGGTLIGLSVALLLLFNGRIAGISGILGGVLHGPRQDSIWRIAFLIGLFGAPILAQSWGKPIQIDVATNWYEILLAGFLVGLGTRYAGGCTSGHGVCGLARGSVRSLVATVTFMTTGFLTVFVVRHCIGN